MAALICLHGSIAVDRATAQTIDDDDDGDEWWGEDEWSIGGAKRPGRELRHHVFIPSQLVTDPFATTYFRSTTGAGFASSTGPGFSVTGELTGGDRDYSQAVLSQAFELQVAPWPWLALRVGGTAVVYSGVDVTSVIALGATAQTGVTAGLTLTPPKATWFRPAIVFDVDPTPAYAVTLLEGLQASIEAGRIVRSTAFESGTSTTFRPGLSGAFALDRALGLVLDVRYIAQSGDALGAAIDDDAYSLGIALDLDLRARTPIPIGFASAFRWIDRWSGDATANKELDLGVFYTGQRQLVLGLIGTFRAFLQRPVFDTTVWGAILTMRYYW
jgi:hypothetical protein